MQEIATLMGKRRQIIRRAVTKAMEAARQDGKLDYEELVDFAVERPREAAHGDFAVNVAMMMAKPCHMAPRDIAKLIAEYIDFTGTGIAKMEIAGPGFINLRMEEDWLGACLEEIIAQGANFGQCDLGQGEKIQVEFVSANPTGELHMGNARGAAIGDSLAAILGKAGYQVEREFYVNDAGNQIEKFANTLNALYLMELGYEAEFPEDGYHGADLPVLIKKLVAEIGDKYMKVEEPLRKEYLAEYALEVKLTDIRTSLANFGVEYDCWFSERTLHDSGAIKEGSIPWTSAAGCWKRMTLFGLIVSALARKNRKYWCGPMAYPPILPLISLITRINISAALIRLSIFGAPTIMAMLPE